jgi:nucleotide-binding universal stress UspA family protein
MTAPVDILAAVDFSPDACRAGERAAQLAGATGARLTLLHVLEERFLDRMRRLLQAAPEAQLAQQAMAELEQQATGWRQRHGAAIECRVRAGDPASLISAEASAHGLLALGAHGHHRLRELAVGTTAQRLVRRVVQPTLVVHRDVTGPYRRVLVASDFSPHALAALRLALALAPEAEIHVLHAVRPWLETEMAWAGVDRDTIAHYRDEAEREAESDLRTFVASAKPHTGRITPHVEHAYAPVALKRMAAHIGADLLVVGKHGKSLTEELLLGSVTQHVLAESPCDVLVATAPEPPGSLA